MKLFTPIAEYPFFPLNHPCSDNNANPLQTGIQSAKLKKPSVRDRDFVTQRSEDGELWLWAECSYYEQKMEYKDHCCTSQGQL